MEIGNSAVNRNVRFFLLSYGKNKKTAVFDFSRLRKGRKLRFPTFSQSEGRKNVCFRLPQKLPKRASLVSFLFDGKSTMFFWNHQIIFEKNQKFFLCLILLKV